MIIRMFIVIGIFLFLILAKYSVIQVSINNILTTYDYNVSLIHHEGKLPETDIQKKILYLEITHFNDLKTSFSRKDFKIYNEEETKTKIRSKINDTEWMVHKEVIADRLFNRLKDYYNVQTVNVWPYILISILGSFIVEIILAIRNTITKADRKKELRFLKKVFVVNGSIKPISYKELIEDLLERSIYYKKDLKAIRDGLRSNTISNKDIYNSLVKNTKNIEIKLFYEKLDLANNYDMDLAIRAIKHEFTTEEKARNREVAHYVERINVFGMLGTLSIFVVIFLYMIYSFFQYYMEMSVF
ncbi:hypothetical protein [Vallitalea guaymasensis]|uniref:hypothetical protein n=1 Tax=Vallitalea guaymasensis TaxID=1185412 RepID=UPI001290881A|nr:hypothetical protein [Vallitalea guaymasensis]